MLGLLGTVQGMVASFDVIAKSATSPKPYELADGIATALFTTLEGLIVAIPAIFFFAVFKNRLARYLMESGYIVDNLMSRFQTMGKPSAPAAAARPGGAPATAPAAPQQ
jgi:biopolymer transport protein ExbB